MNSPEDPEKGEGKNEDDGHLERIIAEGTAADGTKVEIPIPARGDLGALAPVLDARPHLRKPVMYCLRRLVNNDLLFPKEPADFTTEELQNYLQYLEACAYMQLLSKTKTCPYITAGIPPEAQSLLTSIAKLKTAAELDVLGEKTPPNIEEQIYGGLSAKDLYLLKKAGRDGGSQYAPFVSKLIHAITHGPEFGRETAEGIKARMTAVHKENDRENKRPEKSRRALEWKTATRPHLTTTAQKVNNNAINMLYALTSSPREYIYIYDLLYDRLFWGFCEALAGVFLHNYYARDNEQITEDNIKEMSAAVYVTFLLKFKHQILAGGSPSELPAAKKEADRLLAGVKRKIAEYEGAELAEAFEQRLNACGSPTDADTHLASVCAMRAPVWYASIAEALNNPSGADIAKQIEKFQKEDTPAAKTSPIARRFVFPTAIAKLSGRLKTRTSLLPSLHIARESIQGADNHFEITAYLSYLLAKNETPTILAAREEALKHIENHPEFIPPMVETMIVGKLQKDQLPLANAASFLVFERLFSAERTARNPALLDILFAMLFNPDYRAFYNACAICGDIIERENAEGPFTNTFCGRIFANGEDFFNPLRRTVLVNVTERMQSIAMRRKLMRIITSAQPRTLPDGKRVSWTMNINTKDEQDETENGANKPAGCLPDQPSSPKAKPTESPKERAARLAAGKAEKKAAAAAERARKLNEPVKLLRSLSGRLLEPRGTADLMRSITQRRSIQISDAGHEVGVHHLASQLADVFNRLRIKRSKETGFPPQGVACNVTFFGANTVLLYCSLEPAGDLVLRILEDGTEVRQIRRADLAALGIAEAVWDELRCMALEALEIIYVRKEQAEQSARQKAASAPVRGQTEPEAAPPEPAPPAAPPAQPPPAAIVSGSPAAAERFEHEMTIDTDKEAEAAAGIKRQRDLIRIGSNRKLVYGIFAPLARGEALPADPPEEIDSAQIWRKKRENGEFFHEIAPDNRALYEAVRRGETQLSEIYVRVSSAHAEILPYRYTERHADRNPAKPFFTVRRKSKSRHADKRYGSYVNFEHGEALDLSDTSRMSYHEVAASDPEFVRLHARLQTEKILEGHLATARRELEQELTHRAAQLQAARGRNSERPLAELERTRNIILQARARMEQLAALREKTTSSPAPITDEPDRRLLRFPQGVLPYSRTFNHGRFQSVQALVDSLQQTLAPQKTENKND